MALPDDFIYSLKQNNPIENVIGSYVSLKKQSRDYICLCPFHSEKTPSCHVHPSEGFFHCFGCGAGGDVITFIMKAENLQYIEAVKLLAERAGMPMPEDARNNDFSRQKARILEINRSAAKFFNKVLRKDPAGEKGRRYFQMRQLDPKTIIKYGLGYAPDSWHSLSEHLKTEGFTEDEMVAANLCGIGRNGGIYDQFRDRVMFPIIDLRGNVIAFGGRIIDGSGPKYLNSSDTPVFKKSRNLFSLNFAKNSDEKRLILAEGYMDVISINQAGFENVVATLGTALTPEQARLMSQYAEEVIISYDSDGAGQNATHKAINLLSEAGVRTKIIRMEGAKDPDEYIKKFGSLRFKQLLDNSDGAINFELAKCRNDIDMNTDQGRVEYLKKCADVLASITSPIERDVYISKVAKEQGVSREAVTQQVESIIRRRKNTASKQEWLNIRTFSSEYKNNPDAVKHPAEFKAECGIISFLYKNPDETDNISHRLAPECFINDFNRLVYQKIIEKIKNSADFDIMSLQSEFTADEMGKITAILAKSREIEINRSTAEDYINILLKSYSERTEQQPASDMSDDDFRNFARSMRNNK
ncbi:MAG: DNA primase [Oscillospiraceae bacterium]|nr:DNA primase [Oscillospiraceae bacterium]